MVSTSPNGKSTNGCWTYLANEIHVRYSDGDLYSYSPDAFTYVDDEKK